MLSSRDIDLLRSDVAANCRKLIALAAEQGYPVLVTCTVRDDEAQLAAYNAGRSNSKVPTFHSVDAGLAFDICKNVKGEEYSDKGFWAAVSAIGKAMGFTWGGDWKMVDMPHFQWDGPDHEYTSTDILRGNYPPEMPLYEEETEMLTYEQFKEYMDQYMAEVAELPDVNWGDEWQQAKEWAENEAGLIKGDTQGKKMYRAYPTRQQLVLFLYRLKDLM